MFQRSESIKNIITALGKAQSEFKPALKDKDNPYFKSKYADLSSIIDVVRSPFKDNGLSFSQHPSVKDDGKVILTTVIAHGASGEWIACDYPVISLKSDPQALGSAMTYAKRYSLASLAGVATEDDDGNAASNKEVVSNQPKNYAPQSTVKIDVFPENHTRFPGFKFSEVSKEDLIQWGSLVASAIKSGRAVNNETKDLLSAVEEHLKLRK